MIVEIDVFETDGIVASTQGFPNSFCFHSGKRKATSIQKQCFAALRARLNDDGRERGRL